MTLAARGAEHLREGGCNKVPYADADEARHQARAYGARGRPRLRPYPCGRCEHWHLTSETAGQARERSLTGRPAQTDSYHRDYYSRRLTTT